MSSSTGIPRGAHAALFCVAVGGVVLGGWVLNLPWLAQPWMFMWRVLAGTGS
jgi:hypothetical protein